jgi:hypothetical protein
MSSSPTPTSGGASGCNPNSVRQAESCFGVDQWLLKEAQVGLQCLVPYHLPFPGNVQLDHESLLLLLDRCARSEAASNSQAPSNHRGRNSSAVAWASGGGEESHASACSGRGTRLGDILGL